MKTNIKLRVTPEQSEAIQKICFANGVFWYSGNAKEVRYPEAAYLFIEPGRIWFRGITDHNIGTVTEGYTEVDADLFIRTNGACEEPEECQFAKYGFEKPDFECEIFKCFEDDNTLVGYYKTKDGTVYAESWHSLNGRADGGENKYNMKVHLTPIKKPWYETCKFPCLITANYFMPVSVHYFKDGYVSDFIGNKYCVKTWRLLTNEEIEELKQ